MNLTDWIGRMLGLEHTQTIDKIEPSLAARWASSSPAWLLFGCLAAAAIAVLFYTRYQYRRKRGARIALALMRAVLLSLLLLILAEPVLTVRITSRLRPALWLLFDGTDSMAIADEFSESDRARLAEAVGLSGEKAVPGAAQSSPSDKKESEGSPTGQTGEKGHTDPAATSGDPAKSAASASARASRIDYVKALVQKTDNNLVERLKKKFRLRAFLFDRPDGVRALDLGGGNEGKTETEHLAGQLTTEGQVTAIGGALVDLSRRHSTGNLAGLVVFSDFNQNAGPPALESARKLGVAAYTVGVGPVGSVDLAVDLQVPPLMKKDERSSLIATVRQEGLTNHTATVQFSLRKISGSGAASHAASIGQRIVRLADAVQTVDLPYVPAETGQFVFAAEVEPAENEVITQNNRAERETTVRDDFLRLLFVEYEPTWEWRFVKEVFHRDKLVGMRGFRTFLRSADPRVRQTNELFLQTLSPTRSEFFANDVIVLGDMPASALTPRFCQMAEEFVSKFGGGMVILAGPRFGPGQLAQTALADALPVKVDPGVRIRDRQPFVLHRTPDAAQFDFMQLGADSAENDKAWNNLGPLPWYQPVERLRPLATAIAEHPSDTCVDGKTRQPVIAMHNYGRGEVIYVGFNELWRLRRMHGEKYYRQFWGQLIHRLALRHALGTQKRFVVRTDRKQYQPDDQVLLTVEAYDANFEPLHEDKLAGRRLSAEVFLPERKSLTDSTTGSLSIAQLRPGVFEARLPVFASGEHRIRVKDPVINEFAEVSFRVASVSAERQRAVRNTALQQALADATGGVSYDLTTVDRLVDDVKLETKTETSVEVIPLWNTWLAFGCVVLLMLGEWLGRKWVNLP